MLESLTVSLFTFIFFLFFLIISIRAIFYLIYVVQFHNSIMKKGLLSYALTYFARNPERRKDTFNFMKKRKLDKDFVKLAKHNGLLKDEKEFFNEFNYLLFPIGTLSTYTQITDMIELAFDIAPLILFIVILGALFKVLKQFREGEF